MWSMKDKTLSGLEADKIKRNFWTYAVLLAALGAMTFFGVCDPSGSVRGPRGSAAVIDGEVISRNEFNRAYRNAYERYQRQLSDQFDPAQMRLAHNVMQELVDERMMYLKALELGIRASDDEIVKLLSEEQAFKDESGQFSEQTFENFLRGQGYTEAGFMEEIRRSLTVQKLRRFITESTYVSSKEAELDYRLNETKLDIEYVKLDPQKVDAALAKADVEAFLASEEGKKKIKDYYDANMKEFNQPEQVKARHILVAYKGARNATPDAATRTKEEAKKRADELRLKAAANPAEFAKLAKETTDEPAGKTSGGDLGFFGRDAMVKEFSDAAFPLAAGQVSGVVETPFGFHVIKVEEKKPAKSRTLEQAQAQIAENLLAKEKRPQIAKEQADKLLAELKAGSPGTDVLTQNKLQWAATGETALSARYLPGIGAAKEVSEVLASLKKPGDLYPQVLDVRGNLYVLRLKSRQEPDVAKLDKKKKEELAQTAAFSGGFAHFNTFEKKMRDELGAKKQVWMNPEYLALDDQAQAKNAGG